MNCIYPDKPPYVCPVCLREVRRPAKRTCLGNGEPPPPPAPPKRLANFTKAAIAHWLNGSPTCTQEQIDHRAAICRACPLFIPSKDDPTVGVCGHSDCGCNVSNVDKYLNKLAWADQQCPDTPPRWIASDRVQPSRRTPPS